MQTTIDFEAAERRARVTAQMGECQRKIDALTAKIKQLGAAISDTPTHCVATKLDLADQMFAAKRQRDMQFLLPNNLREIRND